MNIIIAIMLILVLIMIIMIMYSSSVHQILPQADAGGARKLTFPRVS